MKKLRVGVWVDENYSATMGGGFGYFIQILDELSVYNFKDAEIVFIAKKFSKDWSKKDKSYQIETPNFSLASLPLKFRIINKLALIFGIKLNSIHYSRQKNENNKKLIFELSQVIDLIYYPIPGCQIENFPFVYTLWDLGHLSTYSFPELSLDGVFEERYEHHILYPYKALMVFCESETGKKQAVQFLNLNSNNIKVIPLFSSEIINSKYSPERPPLVDEDAFFIHYPAQFWAHKNHYNLILAFKEVMILYPSLKLIFTGADKGNKAYIASLISELNLTNQIIDLGFIAIEELKWLYLHSQGLVMPTLLGPTNMPILEAAALGCPVACTDLTGHKEQLGDYGYYFDALQPSSISESILAMIENNKNDIKKQYNAKFTIENALIQIDKAFTELKNVRFCWGNVK